MNEHPIDYPFLLMTHMVCADQQIHCEEFKALREFATQAQVGKNTLEAMEKILAQDDELLSVEEVARRIPTCQRQEALYQILAIAYVDGFCSLLERQFAERVAKIWNFSPRAVQRQIQIAGAFSDPGFTLKEAQKKISVSARLLQKADFVLSKKLVNKWADLTGKQETVEQLRREILLSGSEYDEAIGRCATIAKEDYKWAKFALNSTRKTLSNLGKDLQNSIRAVQFAQRDARAITAREVIEKLEKTRKSLRAEIIVKIENVRESLGAKERALNHFSIAFMGKTKAGKSTLHAIITDDGWEAIGVGKQRTTRYNRVYEWKNIRIIDTPGIGAPGGKSDEEIAESVIEESDVICYVVTNDSIQETEFQFLHLLKKKAKPLIILLNVKKNLRDSRRLEHFLKNPDRDFAMDGKSGLGGHIDRIRRYAQQHYTNDYFPIIPVMLLAAQLSREPEHKEQQSKLFKASRIQDFLDAIRESLIESGTLRRSQTLLGSTVGSINEPRDWVMREAQGYGQLAETIQHKREKIHRDIEKAKQDSWQGLKQSIEEIFQDARDRVQPFAEQHWQSDESQIKSAWQAELESIKFEDRLQIACQNASNHFNRDVKVAVEEIGKELQLISELVGDNFVFAGQYTFYLKEFLKITGGVIFTAGTVLAIFLPPIGIVVGIIGSLIGLSAMLFQSTTDQRRSAVQKISESLYHHLNTQKLKTIDNFQGQFLTACENVKKDVESYFDNLAKGLKIISQKLEKARQEFDRQSTYLNQAYAKRILDWSLERYEPLTKKGIQKTVAKVKRNFGRHMTIFTYSELPLKKLTEELKNILQEGISILVHQSTH